MQTLHPALDALQGKDSLTEQDALVVRAVIFPDMNVSADEAEMLFALNDAASTTAPEWRALFVEALTDFLVRQQEPAGYVDEAAAKWLVARIARDGHLKGETELELLIRVLEDATAAPEALSEVALAQIAAFALSEDRRAGDGPTLTSQEVGQIRRVIYAFADPAGAATVSRKEAEVLFMLNDAARGRPNASEWRDLFVYAIGAAILAPTGHVPPSAAEALRRQNWLRRPSEGVGVFLANMLEALIGKSPRLDEDVFANREAIHMAETLSAAPLTADEVSWLAEQIGRDGLFDDNELALLRFVESTASTVHPSLQDLIGQTHTQAAMADGGRPVPQRRTSPASATLGN